MKKFVLTFGIAFAAVGAVLTLIVLATLTSEDFPFSFQFGMTVIAPSVILGRALGIQEGMNAWLWYSLAMVANTILCFSAGTLVGFVVRLLTRGSSKNNEVAG